MKVGKEKKGVQENGNKIVWKDGTVTYSNANGEVVTRKMNVTERSQILIDRFTRQRKHYRKGSKGYESLTNLIEKNIKITQVTKPFTDAVERRLELTN